MNKEHILLLCILSGAVLYTCSNEHEIAKAPVNVDPDLRTVLELNTDVRSVSMGGLWSHDGKEGWIRFVVTGGGVEHSHMHLYVQWLSQEDDSEQIELVSTVPVVELNGPITKPASITHYSFVAPVCEDKISCTRATLEAFDTRNHSTKRFSLLLDEGPGRYRLVPQVLSES